MSPQSEETKIAVLGQQMSQVNEKVGDIKNDISNMSISLRADIADLSKDFKSSYVTKDEFAFIKWTVYTIMGAITTGLIAGALAFLLKKP